MSQEEKELLEAIEHSTGVLKKTAAAMTGEAAARKRSDGGWSVWEIIEHITIVDGRFRERIDNGTRLEAEVRDKEHENQLRHRMFDRTQKRAAPETSLPRGTFSNAGQATAALDANLEANRQFLRRHQGELRKIAFQHPRFGQLTGYDVALIMAGHALRHVEQIEELKREFADAAR